jgi:DNA-binding XRE family transcriptional regulator
MINPYKAAREDLGLSQASVAEASNVSRHYVLRVEQGLFHVPSPRLSTTLNISHMELTDTYHEWQHITRALAAPSVAEGVEKYFQSVLVPLQNKHPHIKLRQCITDSQVAFCILLKIQPSRLSAYEKSKGITLPLFLKEAYFDCGVTPEQLNRIESRFRGATLR